MKTNNMQSMSKISIFGSVFFILLLILMHLIKPEIDPNWQPISEYALGRNGWLMRLAFFLMMLATATATLVSWKFHRSIRGRIGTVLLAISCIGFLLAGVFNTDPSTTPNENMTTVGILHSIGAGFSGMIVFASLFIVWQFYKDPIYRKVRRPLVFATTLLWVSEITLIISMAIYLPRNDGNLGPETIVGWQGRFMIICAAIWIIIFIKQTVRIEEYGKP